MSQATPHTDPHVVRRTQKIEIARSIPLGIILPLETSVLLTVAIKHFDASGITKGLIAASGGIGLLLAPAVTAWTRRRNRSAMGMAASLSIVTAIGFAIAMIDALPLFVAGSLIALAAANAMIPLVIVTYERNFPPHERGRRVGRGMAMKVAVSAPLAIAMGSWLHHFPDLWWVVVGAGVVAAAALAVLHRRVPSEPLSGDDDRFRLLPHFELLAHDRQLRLTLTAWMLMGFGNLMLVPLRVEYLAQPRYGIEADAATITLLTVAIPAIVRLLVTPFFGRLFDRLSFFAARIMVNLLFAGYVVAFFTGSSTFALWSGAIMLGVAVAGGDLMWMLWVIKFAPPTRVADYMGLHTFFTGLRAVTAPLLAFTVVGYLALGWIAVLTVTLIVLSSLVLVPEVRAERRRRRAIVFAVAAGK